MNRHVSLLSKPRGTSLIEVMIAMSVALVGLTGLMSVQTMAARSNKDSQRVRQASSLAIDLEENVRRWGYSDARLGSAIPVTSLADPLITNRWDMGNAAIVPTTSKATFAERKGSQPQAAIAS